MKEGVKKAIRKVVKGPALRLIEDEFRIARASHANALYNWPAKDMRVIMITGTNGKTTTAHFLFSILRKAGYSVGLSSTAEFRIDDQVEINDTNRTALDPVVLLRQLGKFRDHRVDFVILEATSQALDQHRLWGIPCEVAIFTNLTQDHLDYHKSMENYAKAKARLWDIQPKVSVLNRDSDWYDFFNDLATGRKLSYGKKPAEITVSDYKAKENTASFKLGLPDGSSMITLHLSGIYNAYNAAAAAGAATALGINGEVIEEGIESLQELVGRLQFVPIKKPYEVIVDYAHTPDGLEKVLKAVKDMTENKLWLVFGACGDRDKAKRPVMGEIAAKLADAIVLTDEESYGEDPQAIRDELRKGIERVKGGEKKTTEFADRREAIKYALDNAKKGDSILITGLGHENHRIENGKRIPWNDADVVQKLATKRKASKLN